MDIRNVKTFIKVAELKNFTKAAAEMSYVQSTVTMQIQQLERELGYPLFDRIGKKVSLTSLGKEFLYYAYELVRITEKAENIGKDVVDIGGSLHMGVSESLMFSVITELLPEFKEKFRNLEIGFKTGHIPELIEQLKQNKLDMVYVTASFNTDPELICHYKHKEKLIFISGTEHYLADKKKIPFEELLKNEFLVTEHEGTCQKRLRELAARYNSGLICSLEVDSAYVITELVKKGMGLAFLPEYYVKSQLVDGSLIKLDIDIEPQVYYSQILSHKSRWLSPFMVELINMIKEKMN